MSNARSPREVCSTTIGTRGLMALALFRGSGRNPSGECDESIGAGGWPEASNGFSPVRRGPTGRGARLRRWTRRPSGAGRPQLSGRLRALLLRRPELLACLGLIQRDRLRVLDQHVDCLAHRDVLAQRLVAALLLRALQRRL